MQLRSFTGRTIADAMARAHAALGSDAIMLHSDRLTDGSGVILRAAAGGIASDEAGPAPAMGATTGTALAVPRRVRPVARPAVATSWPAFIAERSGSDGLNAVDTARLCMLYHGLSEGLIEDWIAHRDSVSDGKAIGVLVATLTPILDCADGLDQRPGARLMIAGAAGAGRSVYAARMAIALHRTGQPVVLIDSGAHHTQNPAHRLAAACGVPLSDGHGDDPASAIARDTTCVIDLPAMDPRQRDDWQQLRRHGVRGEIIPVIAANGNPHTGDELGRAFADLGARRLLVSHCDGAGRLGALVMAATGGGLRLSATGDSGDPRRAPGPASAGHVARLLARVMGGPS
ncbi:MAG: hypothetical protein RII27_00115 [Alphaproteobacteria bacterium]